MDAFFNPSARTLTSFIASTQHRRDARPTTWRPCRRRLDVVRAVRRRPAAERCRWRPASDVWLLDQSAKTSSRDQQKTRLTNGVGVSSTCVERAALSTNRIGRWRFFYFFLWKLQIFMIEYCSHVIWLVYARQHVEVDSAPLVT
jgi:hypothetical protein